MNAIKRVKILITLGLLANTLYITPLWAEASFSEAMEDAFTFKYEETYQEIVLTEQAREFMSMSFDDDGVVLTFTEKGQKSLSSMDAYDQDELFEGLYDQYSDSAHGLSNITIKDSNGTEIYKAELDNKDTYNWWRDPVESYEPGDEPGDDEDYYGDYDWNGGPNEVAGAGLMDTQTTEKETMAPQQESQVQSGMRSAQKQSGGDAAGTAGALSK
jgi:hypothetical protein